MAAFGEMLASASRRRKRKPGNPEPLPNSDEGTNSGYYRGDMPPAWRNAPRGMRRDIRPGLYGDGTGFSGSRGNGGRPRVYAASAGVGARAKSPGAGLADALAARRRARNRPAGRVR
jgi:hypothetical protein